MAATQDLLPLLNRDIIKDPKGLKFVFLEELWNSPIESIIKTPPKVVDKNDDKVRHAFVLRRDHVAKLKKWVSIECKSTYGLELESLHISTFVVTSALMWVCKVQSEEEVNAITIANNNNNDEIYSLKFQAGNLISTSLMKMFLRRDCTCLILARMILLEHFIPKH